MKTVLYYTNTQKIKYHKPTGYYMVDGVRPELPATVVELTVAEAQPPAAGANERVTGGQWIVDLDAKQYKRDWQIVPLTAQEIINRDWGSSFPLRLDVNGAVLFDPMGNAYRSFLTDKGYDVRMNADNSYTIFLDEIIPSHRPFVDSLKAANLLTETTKPTVK